MALKKKEYSDDLRKYVITHSVNGDSEHEIAWKMIRSIASVHYIITKYKETQCVQNIISQSRIRKTPVQLEKAAQRKVKVDRHKLASATKTEIESELGIIIFMLVVCRRLHEVEFKNRVARNEPNVDKANRIKRVEYGREDREKPLNFQNPVLWTDKSKINCLNQREKLWSGERLKKKNIIPNVQFLLYKVWQQKYKI